MKRSRMLAKDYRREYEELKKSELSLNSHTIERLLTLSTIHLDAIILQMGDTDIKARSLSESWIKSLSIEDRIIFIERIEDWSLEQQNIKQLKISDVVS